LLWKEPHPIFFAHLEYQCRPTKATLDKWADVVEGTADNMASVPIKDDKGVYHLEPVMPPSEIGISKDTVFDLAYWRFGLLYANKWREMQDKPRNPHWDEVAKNLAPLPTRELDGETVYCHSVEWTDSMTTRNWEHPDLIGVFGMLPPLDGVDKETARRTVKQVAKRWQWDRCWGWDFPWITMAAARLGEKELAVDMLLYHSHLNSYPENGINGGWYLPGNGGVLYAVAMMCQLNAFPDGWKVKYEGLQPAL